MLMPKRVKHRKQFRGSMAGKATRGNKLTYGEYGIVAMEPCLLYTSDRGNINVRADYAKKIKKN